MDYFQGDLQIQQHKMIKTISLKYKCRLKIQKDLEYKQKIQKNQEFKVKIQKNQLFKKRNYLKIEQKKFKAK